MWDAEAQLKASATTNLIDVMLRHAADGVGSYGPVHVWGITGQCQWMEGGGEGRPGEGRPKTEKAPAAAPPWLKNAFLINKEKNQPKNTFLNKKKSACGCTTFA